ncbi:SGNH/GDSL hydrolase family protein [Cutibacterium sp. WCA-380-WT-3A]|uniref:SGNH/GDSL hydrolase family protein n=1 Tax=Cutibacterium porci TaxID=2605781 RepID=A0A7K0J8I9_9ACTN|nr:SGNH/GDSL hydrolase family protein [Cutibacterium porci]MSS46267.1 SGNH/GDSL hydrolase family protein [Cutibacterium porci]
MKRILRILSVVVVVVVVAGVAIGLRPNSHAFGSVFRVRHTSRSASVADPGTPASPAGAPTWSPDASASSADSPTVTTTRAVSEVGRVTGHGGTLTTLGLGDSVPQGGPCTNCTTFVERVGTDMARHAGVKAAVRNESVSGYKTADVLTQLESTSAQSLLKTSDLAIVTIGANDFDLDALVSQCADSEESCVAGDVNDVTDRVRTILERIKAGMTTPGATIAVTGYWNVGLDGKVGRDMGADYVKVSTMVTEAFNANVKKIANDVGAVYVDVRTPFKGADGRRDDTALLTDDGDHPSDEGHKVLAEAVEAQLS